MQRVLLLMLKEPTKQYYGREMAREVNLQGGTLYPLLERLERAGWVTSEWEAINPEVEGRPRRRYYTLTNEGLQAALKVRADLIESLGTGTVGV